MVTLVVAKNKTTKNRQLSCGGEILILMFYLPISRGVANIAIPWSSSNTNIIILIRQMSCSCSYCCSSWGPSKAERLIFLYILLELLPKVATLLLDCCRIGILQFVYIGTFGFAVIGKFRCGTQAEVHLFYSNWIRASRLYLTPWNAKDLRYENNAIGLLKHFGIQICLDRDLLLKIYTIFIGL